MEPNIIEKAREKLQQYEQRNQEIVNAAIRMFNKNGYAGTTTASIAAEANVTERTMYRHFRNKEVLFIECIFAVVSELMELLQQQIEKHGDDPLVYLTALASSYINFVKRHPDKSMFLVHLYSYREFPEIEENFKKIVNERIIETERVIRELQAKGVVKTLVDPKVLSAIFVGQYFTMVFLREFVDPELFNEATGVELTKTFLRID